jgi:hypothetical protein
VRERLSYGLGITGKPEKGTEEGMESSDRLFLQIALEVGQG